MLSTGVTIESDLTCPVFLDNVWMVLAQSKHGSLRKPLAAIRAMFCVSSAARDGQLSPACCSCGVPFVFTSLSARAHACACQHFMLEKIEIPWREASVNRRNYGTQQMPNVFVPSDSAAGAEKLKSVKKSPFWSDLRSLSRAFWTCMELRINHCMWFSC